MHIGTTVFIRPYLMGDRIAYFARITVSAPVPDKVLDKQTTRMKTTSHDLYVSGALKDGDEFWFDFSASQRQASRRLVPVQKGRALTRHTPGESFAIPCNLSSPMCQDLVA